MFLCVFTENYFSLYSPQHYAPWTEHYSLDSPALHSAQTNSPGDSPLVQCAYFPNFLPAAPPGDGSVK